MSDPQMIRGIQESRIHPGYGQMPNRSFCGGSGSQKRSRLTISMRVKCSLPADDVYHINKHQFKVPFVCGAKDLGEALRRINEGASMIRTKGEPGTGDIVQAVRHMRKINSQIAKSCQPAGR